MGVSTDAILCYGFQIGKAYEPPSFMKEVPEGEDFDFGDFVVQIIGSDVKEPAKFDKEAYDRDPVVRQAWADYWAAKQRVVDGCGVSLITHCSYDSPMYVLAAKASVKRANRGYPIVFDGDIAIGAEWCEVLSELCAKGAIPMGEPKWILCSMWG